MSLDDAELAAWCSLIDAVRPGDSAQPVECLDLRSPHLGKFDATVSFAMASS